MISSPQGSVTEQKAVEAGLEIFPFHIGPDTAFWKIRPFQKFLKKHGINVMLGVQNRDIKIGCLAARLTGVPAIFGRLGLDMMKKKIDHRIVFTKFIDGIITNTKSIKSLYDGFGWFPQNFIHVVYDGVDVPVDPGKIDLHAEFDLNPDSKIVIGTGRIVEQKRFDILIDVALMAKKENQLLSFIVVGEGDLKPKLIARAAELGVEDMVRFIGFREDVLSIMNSSEVFVLTSDSEGMSNALREAMGLGLPCVATDVFGVSELFQNGRSGIKVAKGDASAIFNAIKSVISDPKLKKGMEKAAVEHIRSNFTIKGMIDHLERIFQEQIRSA